MAIFKQDGSAVIVKDRHEVMRVEPWGKDSFRVRAAQYRLPQEDFGALEEVPEVVQCEVEISETTVTMRNGALTAEIEHPGAEAGGFTYPMIRFVETDTGKELLAESREHFWWPGARVFFGNRAGTSEIHQQFKAYDDEKIYGLGQRTHGKLDHKGLSLDLVQRNAEVSIPFAVSSRGYGFLWNNPAIGSVTFAENATRWIAEQSSAIDYWITAGLPSEILANYADVTGHAPRLPKWASGLWQSKLRYKSQEELLEVVREYKRRNVPLSVIVTDFFHWTAMGDYQLDPAEYPDPQAMMEELNEANVKLMVSIWPTVSPLAEDFPAYRDRGLLVGSDQGQDFLASIQDKGMDVPMPVGFYDPTNPDTREFVWDKMKRNYFDLGVRIWWLDACEPEINPGHHGNLRYHIGSGSDVGCIFPRDNARMVWDGMNAAANETGNSTDQEFVSLCRSAWAGQQKYSAAVWSGDIPPTWDSLKTQVRAGLSIAMAGIPWWTTDIGGFHGGNINDPEYQELMMRWFQFGAFCPLFRLHGYREPRPEVGWASSGGPNEIWSYGEEAYENIKNVVMMRERLRPYLHEQMDKASESGMPPMRPLLVDFPNDPKAWEVDDQMMFGDQVLVAPVLDYQARQRNVYLPAGAKWTNVWTNEVFEGATCITVDAPLQQIPIFTRDDVELPIVA